MSKYTTEVRYICENAAGYDESKGYADVDKIIEDSLDSVFSFDFPIFDENYRNVICTKILRHYYTREIGFETVGLWKLKLQTKLTEIMPYYNKLYESELLKFNPLYDVDLQTTHVGDKAAESNKFTSNNKEENRSDVSTLENEKSEQGTNNRSSNSLEGENKNVNSSSEGSTASVGNSKVDRTRETDESGSNDKTGIGNTNYTESTSGLNYDLYSDTPQGALTDVDQEEYLTNARKITDSKSKNSNNRDTNIDTEKYSKNNEETIEEKNESNNFSNDSIKNEYGEENARTSVANETTNSNSAVTDKGSRSNVGIANLAENGTSLDKYNSTESYALHVIGKQAGASFSKLLKEFRDTFLNIDMDVINSLSDLFFNLW